MERLRGKVALVTGGASGIGEATVRLFVDEGASVVLADLQDERGRSVAKDAGPRAVYVHADVSCEADVAAMVDETVRRFGRLDCLFNNAGCTAMVASKPSTPISPMGPSTAAKPTRAARR